MISCIKLTDKLFPEELKSDFFKLNKIYAVGDTSLLSHNKMVGVIGSRRMSQYGKDVIASLVPELVESGNIVVSGLAPGVDIEAQRKALEVGGNSIGVLGFGFKYLQNDPSFKFVKSGIAQGKLCVITPFESSVKPAKYTFINRNKIIAGLSKKLYVVEAMLKSGAFHTVEAAIALNREIYAVPGSIFSKTSKGTNMLINAGMKPYTGG